MAFADSVSEILEKHNIHDADLAAALAELLELEDARAHRVTDQQVREIDKKLAKQLIRQRHGRI
jgi:hypothetical protein